MDSRHASRLLLAVIYLGFVSLGLPDGTFGVAWPAMYPELGLPLGVGGTFVTVVTLLSGASGFCSGWVLARFATGPVVVASGLLTGGALLALGRAPGFPWVLAAAVPLGFGAGAVDAALNGYVARHYRGRHMNWLHACWGVGATCGPLAMGQAIAGAGGWRGGYAVLGTVQLGLALLVAATLRLWRAGPECHGLQDTPASGRRGPVLGAASAAGWLSPALFALYAALEASVGLWAASLLILGRGFTPGAAALATAAYYGAITGGRVLAGFAVERRGNRWVVRVGAALALAGLPLFAASTGPAAAAALALTGLGFAPIYPGLMQEVPRRFSAAAVPTVIGRQTGAAYCGVALVPAAAGGLAQAAPTLLPWAVLAGAGLLFCGIRQLDRMTPAD